MLLQDQIRLGTAAGQDFSVAPGVVSWAGGAIANVAVGLWLPATSVRKLIVYSAQFWTALACWADLKQVSANPNFAAGTLTPLNNLGSSAGSQAVATYANTNQTPSGTELLNTNLQVGVLLEVLTNGRAIALAPGQGLTAFLGLPNSAAWTVNLSWLEV